MDVPASAHLEAHRQPVLSGGSFPCANAPVGHGGHVPLLLEQLSHQLRLTRRHTEAPVRTLSKSPTQNQRYADILPILSSYLACFENVDELLEDGVPILVQKTIAFVLHL